MSTNKHELDTLTDYEKCHSVFRAVCEDKDCELSYHELQALQDNGYITDLKRVKNNRWSFEWTEKLRTLALADPAEQKRLIEREVADSA